MASIANSSSLNRSGIEAEATDTPSQQAGPSPRKRGEIGFIEGAADEARSSSPEVILPAHHPADRDHSTRTTVAALLNPPVPSTTDATLTRPSTSALSNNSIQSKVLCFFKPKNNILFYGIRLPTFLILFLLLIILGGTLAGWITLTKTMVHNTSNTSTTTILSIHILFGVCVLSELLLLERRVYHLRAERYAHFHPGENLPTARDRRPLDIPFAPWNRPSLPTYASTLAQSGTATGDVEDHLIAQPPPPAYGNTRGSTLLLSGHLRNSLLAQGPHSSQGHLQSWQSQMSQRNDDRPKSYHSRDEEWEEIQDAARARRLEETLARMERPLSP
ncbi:hypothetical protein C0992_010895 [Termitomyces sp. T32_za158]|nr:hypothetical protein C0992_010895 [Termitomyces sp. T32_za158]